MRSSIFLQGLMSFLIVAFGQPSFVPWLGPISAAFGYALFWRAIRKFPFSKQRFWRAFVWYGSVTLVQLSWMSSIEFQGFYILVVWVALAVWLGIQFGLLSILIPYNRPLSFPRIFAMASIWTLIEWGRFYFICGYTWNPSGLALSNPLAIQLASIFGVLGLSFWVIFANLVGVRAFLRKGIVHYLIWAGVVAVPYVYGFIHIQSPEKRENTYSCTLVQTGLLPSEKNPLSGKIRSFISPYDQWHRILLFLQNTKKTDLIVLPETAVPLASTAKLYEKKVVKEIFKEVYPEASPEIFPVTMETKVSNQYFLQTIANHFDCEVIAGLDHVEDSGISTNSAFFARPHHSVMDRYDKRVLMPLAEYLPFKIFAPLVKSYGISDFFTPGKKANLFHGKLPISTSICYEETFPEKVREGRVAGAKLLVNVTNDGWYPHSKLPSQHFEHARFRAVENGAPLLRSCNTGVTAVVDSFGHTVAKLDPYTGKKKIKSGVVSVEFNPYEFPTLYLIWGNWGIVAISLVLLTFFVLLKRQFDW